MHSLCSKSSLCVTDERELVTLFTKYLEHREALPPLPEDDPMRLIEDQLTTAEKETRKTDKDAADVLVKAKTDEVAAAKKAEFEALQPLGK